MNREFEPLSPSRAGYVNHLGFHFTNALNCKQKLNITLLIISILSLTLKQLILSKKEENTEFFFNTTPPAEMSEN